MATRLGIIILVLVLTPGVTGCALSTDRVEDCAAPANEGVLLDELAKDPVLDVTLSGATRRGEPQRQEACHRKTVGVTGTSVYVDYDLSHDPSAEEVRAAFDPVAVKAGWAALPGTANPVSGAIHYCRRVHDQPLLLTVGWESAKTVDSSGKDERVPAHLSVVLHASADGGMIGGGMADAQAARRAVGCSA